VVVVVVGLVELFPPASAEAGAPPRQTAETSRAATTRLGDARKGS